MDSIVTIGGQSFAERWQILPFEQAVTVSLQTISPINIPLPGSYPFLLKALTRETVSAAGASVDRRFKCRIGNTDGGTWYSQAGRGGTTDRVLDSLLFGSSGAFPYVVIPALFYSPNSSIMMEVEDVSQTVPYTIIFAFHGSYLIPVNN